MKCGDLGGWIEKESNLSHKGTAWVDDNAWVCDNARVGGDARVCDNDRVGDNARVGCCARVFGDAEILSCNHYRVFGPAGSRNDFTTFFRAKDLKIYVKCGCFLGTIDEFERKVAETHGDNQYAHEYHGYANIARKYIDLSPMYSTDGK